MELDSVSDASDASEQGMQVMQEAGGDQSPSLHSLQEKEWNFDGTPATKMLPDDFGLGAED